MKNKVDKNFWYVCDFETNTMNTKFFKENNDFKVLAFSTRNWDNSEIVSGTNIDDWWNHLLGKKTSLVVYFHNLKFDGDFILKFWRKKGYSINNFGKQDNSFKVFRNGMRIYYMEFMYLVDGEYVTITLRCSFMILSNSVEALGKSLGISKHLDTDGDDFYDVEPENDLSKYPKRFVEYMENDTEIVRQSLINFENMINSIETIKNYKRYTPNFNVYDNITISSITKTLMKIYVDIFKQAHNFNKDTDFLELDIETYRKVEPFFRGGWTQINDNYLGEPVFIKKGNMYDVKSAYPYQMTMSLPYGKVLEEKPEGEYVEFKTVHINKAKIKKEYYNLPIMINWHFTGESRYVRELKNFTCFYIKEEWDVICKVYDLDIEWESEFYMKSAPFLKHYASEIYAEKEKYDFEGNKAFKQATKILINSGYGSLAMRERFNSFIYIDKNELEMLNKEDNYTIGKGRFKKNYKYEYTSELGVIDDVHKLGVFVDSADVLTGTNKAAAATITARQRVYLWYFILDVGVEHFCYSDTDSVLFGNVTDKMLEKIKKHEGNKLGDWEIENKQNIAWFGTWGAKKYILLDNDKNVVKLKWAGVSEKHAKLKEYWSDLALSSDMINIENATLRAVYTKSGTGFELIPKTIQKKGI